jgi:WD40 repeat protein
MSDPAKTESPNWALYPVGEIQPACQLTRIRFSPCGRVLLGAGFDPQVIRWGFEGDTEAPPERKSVSGHQGWVTTVDFVADRGWAVTADSWGQLRVWPYLEDDPKSIWQKADAHDGWIRDLAVSPDGRWIVTCGRDQRVRRFATEDGRLLSEWSGHEEDIFSVAIHPSGEQLVSGDLKGRIIQWDVKSGKQIREFDASELYTYDRIQDVGGVRRLVFDASGETLAVAGADPDTGNFVKGTARIKIFDWASGELKHNQLIGENNKDVFAHDLLFHPGGFLILVTSGQPGSGRIFLHRPGEEKPFLTYHKGLTNCHSVAMHPNGRIAVASTSKGSNGNGRQLKDGIYVGNHSPVYLFDLYA